MSACCRLGSVNSKKVQRKHLVQPRRLATFVIPNGGQLRLEASLRQSGTQPSRNMARDSSLTYGTVRTPHLLKYSIAKVWLGAKRAITALEHPTNKEMDKN